MTSVQDIRPLIHRDIVERLPPGFINKRSSREMVVAVITSTCHVALMLY